MPRAYTPPVRSALRDALRVAFEEWQTGARDLHGYTADCLLEQFNIEHKHPARVSRREDTTP